MYGCNCDNCKVDYEDNYTGFGATVDKYRMQEFATENGWH